MKSSLAEKHCREYSVGTPALSTSEIGLLLPAVVGWKMQEGEIRKAFRFADYHHTMAFVNAVAWVAHRENHHPELEVGYNRCTVRFSTHTVKGLSENDFICAAKVDALLE